MSGNHILTDRSLVILPSSIILPIFIFQILSAVIWVRPLAPTWTSRRYANDGAINVIPPPPLPYISLQSLAKLAYLARKLPSAIGIDKRGYGSPRISKTCACFWQDLFWARFVLTCLRQNC